MNCFPDKLYVVLSYQPWGHQLFKDIWWETLNLDLWLSGMTQTFSRISLWFDAGSNWRAWLFYFTVVNLTLSGLTATRNVLVRIRLQMFNRLSGSPRVIQGQTVNLPGVRLPTAWRGIRKDMSPQRSGLFSPADWLVWFAYVNPEVFSDRGSRNMCDVSTLPADKIEST